MNWMQCAVLLAPLLPIYVWCVFTADDGTGARPRGNAGAALWAAPLLYGFLPLILLAFTRDSWRKGNYRAALAAALILIGGCGGLGAGVYALRDRQPDAVELSLER